MSIRVNLLKASERRYQGPVSGRFIGFVVIFTTLAASILFGYHLIYTGHQRRAELERARDFWSKLEPRHKEVLEIRSRSSDINKLHEELSVWEHSRTDWAALLTELQRATPATVQLTNLSASDAVVDRVDSDEKPDPYRILRLSINGRSLGQTSESVVIRFINSMRELELDKEVFDTVTLNSMQSDRAMPNARTFAISARGEERDF